MDGEDDGNLALAIHAGEPEAMTCLLRRYGDGLYGYALRLLGDAGDAQEVVQDACVRAHATLVGRYGAERCRTLALRPWLFRIVRNLALNRRRARHGPAAAPLPGPDDLHPAALRDETPADGRLLRQVEHDRLGAALARLGATAREAVVLRFVEELTYAEIAVIAGATEAVVRGRVFRALRRLRATLEEMEADHDL